MMRSWAAFLLISVLGIPVFITSVRPAEPVTVTGQVLDPEGRPVPNAELRLMYASGPPKGWEALTGRADEHGRFTLKYEPGEQYQGKMFQVGALAEGYGLGIASGLPGGPDVAVHLTEAASVSGVVVDAEGEPVPAARVSVLSLRYARRGQRVVSVFWPVECRLQSETDARGRFRIDQFPSGATGALIIDAEGYAEARSQATAPQADARVILVRGGNVTGRVLRNGQPVAGLRVSAQGAGSHDGWGAATSDEDGKYELRDLAPGPYNLMLDPPEGLTAAAHEKVEVKSGETLQELNFQLIEGGLVTGSVRDADTGEPVAALLIGAYGPARPRSSAYVQTAKTDEEGRYEFRLPAGENMLYVMAGVEGYSGDGAQPERRFVQVTEGQISESADFKLKRAPLLRGRALGPEGQYLPDAKVWLLQAALLSPSGSPLARTNAGGRFEAFLRENWQRSAAFYLLIRSADDSLAGLFLIEWDDQTTDFPLQPVAAAVGWVRDTAGQPVQGISVKCLSPRPPDQRFWTRGTVSAGTSDVEGKVELPTIPPGVELTLEAETKGFDVASEWPETLTLQPGETRDIGVLTMNPAGRTVSGLVQDADTDAPASNALVVDLSTGREAVTDDRGRFELTRLRLDRPALLLVRDRSQRLYALRMVDPDEQQPVNLVLKPLASVEGYVVGPQWRPVGGARVVAEIQARGYYGVRTEGRKYLPGLPEARTDGRGHYRLDNLLDGMTYEIRAEAEGHMGAQELTAEGGSQVVVPDLVIWPPPQPPD